MTFIKPYNESDEYFFEEGCFINELLNDERDSDVSIARARVSPGEKTKWHRLAGTTERYLIISGEGLVEVGDLDARQVKPWDSVVISAGDKQRITNTGSEDLVFLAICSPRFETQNYEDLES